MAKRKTLPDQTNEYDKGRHIILSVTLWAGDVTSPLWTSHSELVIGKKTTVRQGIAHGTWDFDSGVALRSCADRFHTSAM